jgi:phosphate:Na+ symporter
MIFVMAFFLFLGGFLYGMYLLREGLLHLSTSSMEKWIKGLTDSPWKGILLGILFTVVLQNSVVVMIITIGLVASKLLTFQQAIGIILGINIGSSITVEIITINLAQSIIPMAFIGAILCYIKNRKLINIGYTLIGLSLVFGAMWGWRMTAHSIRELDLVSQLVLSFDHNLFYAILVGILITAIIYSNIATIGITMGFLSAEAIDLTTGVALILGGNVGISVITLLATIGYDKEARLTAFAYTWLNVLGVLLFYPLIDLLVNLSTNLSSNPYIQLAHINVLMNVTISLIVLPFVNHFGRLVRKIHHY